MDDTEKNGLRDFLLHPENAGLAEALAKSVSNNVCEVTSPEDALDIIFVHCPDIRFFLHKKLITKEILYRYLTRRKILVPSNFTKVRLIEIVIGHWNSKDSNEEDSQIVDKRLYSLEFPINVFASRFTKWFFEKYNTVQLKKEDFWPDCKLQLRLSCPSAIEENIFIGTEAVLQALCEAMQNFDCCFNPNIYENGVQGRMDRSGMAIVLCNGTLHRPNEVYGIFECIFGLVRDPYADNNWKTKMIECIFKVCDFHGLPKLSTSPTFKDLLDLPAVMESLS